MARADSPWKSQGVKNPMRSRRDNYNVPADFVVDGRVYKGIVKNKSGSGVFMAAMESFQVGQEVTLAVTLPGEQKPIKRKGKIVRTTSIGFGVEFTYG